MIQNWHQKETDHASVGWLLRHIAKLHRQVSKAKMPYRPGEDPGQPVILMVMQDSEDMGNTISQNDLARSLHVSNPTVTASLKSLERQGYIERKPDPGDPGGGDRLPDRIGTLFRDHKCGDPPVSDHGADRICAGCGCTGICRRTF